MLPEISHAQEPLCAVSSLQFVVSKASQITAEELFLLIIGNEMEQVKHLLQSTPSLIPYLVIKSKIKDSSNRQFTEISPIQYLVWAKNSLMLKMILEFLNQLKPQVQEERTEEMITKELIFSVRKTVESQYKEVLDKGLDYSITRAYWEGNQRIPYSVKIKGEKHFDLKGLEFCLMPKEKHFKPTNGKIYVRITGDVLYYQVIGLSGEFISDSISLHSLPEIPQPFDCIEDLELAMTPILNITAKRGHTHPTALLSALHIYSSQFGHWNKSEQIAYWCREVGGAQREIPAHFVHELFNPNRSFYPIPSFKEYSAPSALIYENQVEQELGAWFPMTEDNPIGIHCAIYNIAVSSEKSKCIASNHATGASSMNCAALWTLNETRTKEIQALEAIISVPEYVKKLPTLIHRRLNFYSSEPTTSNFEVGTKINRGGAFYI